MSTRLFGLRVVLVPCVRVIHIKYLERTSLLLSGRQVPGSDDLHNVKGGVYIVLYLGIMIA